MTSRILIIAPNLPRTDWLDIEVLRALVDYQPETGALYWRERDRSLFPSARACRSWNSRYAGKRTFLQKHCRGYFVGTIFNRQVLAHRVAFALAFGRWPMWVDHINGDKTDNRASNLREVTMAENSKNIGIPRHNKSGHLGVHWDRSRDKWMAFIRADGRFINLGRFSSLDEAAAARSAANRKYNFHENHGRRKAAST